MWHASCSQICRITSHIRLCGPGGDMCSASAALLAFPNHNPIQPASSLTSQEGGTRLLATSLVRLAAICCWLRCQLLNHYRRCCCLVWSIASFYCPRHFAYLSTSCPISPLLVLRAPALPCPATALAHATGRSWHWGKSVSRSKKHLQPPPYTALHCQQRHLAVAAPSATRSARPVLRLHRHTHTLATAYDRALVAAASPCFGRA